MLTQNPELSAQLAPEATHGYDSRLYLQGETEMPRTVITSAASQRLQLSLRRLLTKKTKHLGLLEVRVATLLGLKNKRLIRHMYRLIRRATKASHAALHASKLKQILSNFK